METASTGWLAMWATLTDTQRREVSNGARRDVVDRLTDHYGAYEPEERRALLELFQTICELELAEIPAED